MHMHTRNKERHRKRANKARTNKESTTRADTVADDVVPEIYEVVVTCRHEAEQRAVFERMCGEGFRCRVLTL
jgi:hypothetical protein